MPRTRRGKAEVHFMKGIRESASVLTAFSLLAAAWSAWAQFEKAASPQPKSPNDTIISNYAQQLLEQGKQIFRYDTFGDETFWGDALRLHQAIAGEQLGGVGTGVSPKTALAVGLKVDVDALPASLVNQL